MIDHFNLPVSKIDVSRKFYDALLSTMDIHTIFENDGAVGYGRENWEFGLVPTNAAILPLHVAFTAGSKAEVDAFYNEAMLQGALSNGLPNLRPQYGASYYAAYVIDPDGHNIEVVYRG